MKSLLKIRSELEKGYNQLISELDENEVKSNIVKFQPRLITGGKGSGHNWLAELPEETIFLCKAAQSGGFALGQFHVLHSFPDAVHLMDNLQGETHIWVDPPTFSTQFKLVRILFTPEVESGSIER